ncbi:MAG: hypothetical protein E7070_11430 [Bacteroidales bacterium]|jgi:hypothetical protein|nr:hypothetical protein [Bacteroidales bacterium]
MTTMQLREELFRELNPLLDSEEAMKRLIKYAKKIAAPKPDPTLMTKEEFFHRVDEAKKGASKSFDNVAELDKYIRSL